MQIGYARVSRGDHQDLDVQVAALAAAGCDPILREEASGGQTDRPELARAIRSLQSGDVLVVWKLDRLSRSLRDLLFTLEEVAMAGAGFRSLTEAVDTTTAAGRLMAQTLGAFAEFERAMIRERTMSGLAHARQAGRLLGRRPSLTRQQRAEIVAKAESAQGSPAQLASLFRVSRSTVQRVLRDHRNRSAIA
ncbi:DNA invertase Pin-like site-specific DNA recombinase [Sphingomonas endophytica]|jgi:DNA invertase Pin-like site-specific DNA recombinase|uniref:DNA invertase Pin-like site-specific DNA recombinase n=1 Tax=Sphingomonas endophytica TaxID=869719 RepID=A0A7X0JEF0_9SPHN|nr:recombinase family protein [Sphingomonas endophytica]MBB6505704.1 DNA invertase Pin-like site-specific DNA recombinase [Sphingomonas endophytica]